MGREFIDLFDDWADHYDETVNGNDNEYHEVFDDYDTILSRVAGQAQGNVLEFGVGTGNLTAKLLEAGHPMVGVEPSKAMRQKAQERFPQLRLFDGDFLQFPEFDQPIETIVSTYAFHHLTDEEKRKAVRMYSEILPTGGKIVFADTVFEHEPGQIALLERVKLQGYENLFHDLKTEYYTFRSQLEQMFMDNGFDVTFSQLNRFVWLINAVKK